MVAEPARPDLFDDQPVAERPSAPVHGPAASGVLGKPELRSAVRPLIATTLSAIAAGSTLGGIFGSWSARALAAASAVVGAGWVLLTLRSRRRTVWQLSVLPGAFLLGTLTLLGGSDPSRVGSLMGDAIEAGRLLRPPVPFDPGWRPIVVVLMVLVAFSAGWVGTAIDRPQLGLVLPLPLLFLTAISLPDDGELLAAVLAFVPLVLALAVLFGGDRDLAVGLPSSFELRRAARGAPLVAGGVVLLVALNSTNFLFPEPVFDPADQPQKPRAIQLGEVEDRVLFEINGDLSGPWKVGVLDVYDGHDWRLPPFDAERLDPVGEGGTVRGSGPGDMTVRIVARGLGSNSTLPGVVDATSIDAPGAGLVHDPRVGVFKVSEGRVPDGLAYTLTLPAYPQADQYRAAGKATGLDGRYLEIPAPPPSVDALLTQAPPGLWDRLDFLRAKLNAVVVAVGAGSPAVPVTPDTVENLLAGNHEGSPFEIVAAEAMLARWAGVPARIGYGFDGVNDEGGVKTVRPRNGANWLEVNFAGLGWTPLIGTPPRAKASLDADPNARFEETILPSDDVAVDIYIPVALENLRQLYQDIRAFLLRALPWVLAAVAGHLALPAMRRAIRRRKRRRWAAAHGPRHQIAVEYAELRDLAIDLNVGNHYDTPLEFLDRVVADAEHTELAWLVARAMYGDLAVHADERDVKAADDLSRSLRQRMLRAQPFQSRLLGALSRASLREPYTVDVPTARRVHWPARAVPRPWRAAGRAAGRARQLVRR